MSKEPKSYSFDDLAERRDTGYPAQDGYSRNASAPRGGSGGGGGVNARRSRRLNRLIGRWLVIVAVLLAISFLLGRMLFRPGSDSGTPVLNPSEETSQGAADSTPAMSADVQSTSGVTPTGEDGLPVTDASGMDTSGTDTSGADSPGTDAADSTDGSTTGAPDTNPNSLANLPPSKENPVIALTFDDGPGKYTDELLDILKAKDVKVTFFVLGDCVPGYPATVKRVLDEGHELGSHTYSHMVMNKASEADVRDQLTKANASIYNATGQYPTVFRPPQGASNDQLLAITKEFELPVINWAWQSCPEDWANRDANYVANHVIDNAANGHVVLLHDIHRTTIDSVEAMIDGLKAKGYRFATVSELMEYNSGGFELGKLYYTADIK